MNGVRDRAVIILDDLDFLFRKSELDKILKRHNEGHHYSEIASEVKREPAEILMALVHIAHKGKKEIRALSNAVMGDNFKKDYWVTGIKYSEYGVPKYKCHYFCKCGKEGNQYITDGIKAIKCHECSAKIKVKKASDNGERDGWGNFYIADWKLGIDRYDNQLEGDLDG